MKVSIDQALKRLPAAPTAKYPQGAPFVMENFSDDFVTWVVLYGPQGGE